MGDLFRWAVFDEFRELASFPTASLGNCDWRRVVSLEHSTGVVDVVRQQVSFELVPGFVLIGVEIAVEAVVHVIHAIVVVNW
jgi:hypothetical protein